MHLLAWIGCLSLLLFLPVAAGTQEPNKNDITLKMVKYDELCDTITKNRGKVVLVDFFTNDCVPCRQAFPHIIEMNRKYADKGLVTISVSLDPWSEEFKKETPGLVLDYLKKKDARMTNLMLNESGSFIAERLRIQTVPCVYVFDRQGRWTQFNGTRLGEHKKAFDDGKIKYYKYTEVEEVVQNLLEK